MSVIEYICATFMVAAAVALLCLDVILIHNIVKAAVEYFRLLEFAAQAEAGSAIHTETETDPQAAPENNAESQTETQTELQTTRNERNCDATPASSVGL